MSFPTPLENKQIWNPGSWLLPASTLSIASALLFIFVILYVYFNENLREVFLLPMYALPDFIKPYGLKILAGSAFIISIFITLITSPRPSRLHVKIWSLIIVLISIVTLWAVLNTKPTAWSEDFWKWLSFQHTLVLATFMGAVTLLPRLLKPRVDSRAIQYVTPITLLFLISFPLSALVFNFAEKIEEGQKNLVNNTLNSLKNENEILSKLTSRDSEISLEEKTNKLIELLSRTKITKDILAIAAKMSKYDLDVEKTTEKEIEEEFSQIFENINKLSESKLPSIYEQGLPPFKYVDEKWKLDTETFDTNKKIVNYYRALDKYLTVRRIELEKSPLENKQDAILKLSETVEVLKMKLDSKFNNWMDRWLVYQMPEIFSNKEYSSEALIEDIMEIPIFDESSLSRFGTVTIILGLPGTDSTLRGYAAQKNNCFFYEKDIIKRHSFFRCFAYNGDEDNMDIALEYRVSTSNSKKGIYSISLLVPSAKSSISLPPQTIVSKIKSAIRKKYGNSPPESLRTSSATSNTIDFYNGNKLTRIKLEQSRKKYPRGTSDEN